MEVRTKTETFQIKPPHEIKKINKQKFSAISLQSLNEHEEFLLLGLKETVRPYLHGRHCYQ